MGSIANLDDQIFALMSDGHDLEQSRKAQAQFIEMVAAHDYQGMDVDELSALVKRSTLASLVDERDRYLETANAKLMHVTGNYVIHDRELVSPAGFTTGEMVFERTSIAAQFQHEWSAREAARNIMNANPGIKLRITDFSEYNG
jgi:hypothetical protein